MNEESGWKLVSTRRAAAEGGLARAARARLPQGWAAHRSAGRGSCGRWLCTRSTSPPSAAMGRPSGGGAAPVLPALRHRVCARLPGLTCAGAWGRVPAAQVPGGSVRPGGHRRAAGAARPVGHPHHHRGCVPAWCCLRRAAGLAGQVRCCSCPIISPAKRFPQAAQRQPGRGGLPCRAFPTLACVGYSWRRPHNEPPRRHAVCGARHHCDCLYHLLRADLLCGRVRAGEGTGALRSSS